MVHHTAAPIEILESSNFIEQFRIASFLVGILWISSFESRSLIAYVLKKNVASVLFGPNSCKLRAAGTLYVRQKLQQMVMWIIE